MKSVEPLVTVIAMCFNHERFLLECLESIRAQTFQDFQLIISDDGSSDQSKVLIRQWIATYDIDCTFVDHPVNVGLTATCNEVYALAKGRYTCFVSTDDVWLSEKLERQLEYMQRFPEDVAVLYGDVEQMDESGIVLPGKFLAAHGVEGEPPQGSILRRLIDGNFIPWPSAMIRRQAVLDVGMFDEALNYEDYDMWVRLAVAHKFAYYDYIGARYRIVSNSLVRTMARGDRPQTLWSDVQIMSKVARSRSVEFDVRRSAAYHMQSRAQGLLSQSDRRGWIAHLSAVWYRCRIKLELMSRSLKKDLSSVSGLAGRGAS